MVSPTPRVHITLVFPTIPLTSQVELAEPQVEQAERSFLLKDGVVIVYTVVQGLAR
jgi:hypothetical protein